MYVVRFLGQSEKTTIYYIQANSLCVSQLHPITIIIFYLHSNDYSSTAMCSG